MSLEAFARVAELLPEAILLLDSGGVIRAANGAAAELLDRPAASLPGRNLSGLTVDSAEALAQYLHACSRAGNMVPGSLRLAAAEGDPVPCRVEGALLQPRAADSPALMLLRLRPKDTANRFVELNRRIEDLGREVLRRQHAEQALKEQGERLVEADRRKDEFLAMLAHELRNPLAPLRNGVRILQEAGADSRFDSQPKAQQVAAMMERQVVQLTRLVDDLLDAARVTRGMVTLALRWVPLQSVLEQAIETVRPVMESRQHAFTAQMPPASVTVNADTERLSQAFANLLTNAAKFTDPGGTIELSAEAQAGQAIIRVRDSGIGIGPGLLPCVFDLFTQGDRSLARSLSGLGIGLTVVKGVVGMHGGEVEARSDGPGQGSEFVVRLPIAASVHAAVTDSAAPASQAREGGTARLRILVVDDNDDAAESLALLIGLWNHDVRVAHSAGDAFEVLTSYRPDVILLDIGLPGMDGLQAARILRAKADLAGILLVAVTGYGQESDRMRSREAGFDHHLTKPVDPQLLQRLLLEHGEGCRAD